MIADTTIKRPALRYFGGKYQLAPWIISFFPNHVSYVEPCGGAGSVLIQKPRSPLETFNDLDGNVVNFFRALRNNRDELVEKIKLTPWGREEYRLSYNPTDEPIERARRFYIRHMMAISASSRYSSGMRMVKELDGGVPAQYQVNPNHLYQVADRFLGVQIEQLDALDCITRYDTENTLFYFDPPYTLETRTSGKEYNLEVDEQFHVSAAELLRSVTGYVVVSGYACQLYTDHYEGFGWKRFDTEARVNGDSKKIESVWLSPRTAATLHVPQQLTFGVTL